MKINWFTLIAQVINFLVLMWLLKRYLYKPVLKAIDERENKIRAQLKDAENQKAEAKKEREEFLQKNETFDRQKNDRKQQMLADLEKEAQQRREQTRNEVNALREKLEKALEAEQRSKSLEISKKVTEEAFAIARKTLTDIASGSLEEQTVKYFIQRIAMLSPEAKKQFMAAIHSGPVHIRSAFELSPAQRQDLKRSVSGILGSTYDFEFTTAPELISGIELSANGYKLSWNISEYLSNLKNDFSDKLEE